MSAAPGHRSGRPAKMKAAREKYEPNASTQAQAAAARKTKAPPGMDLRAHTWRAAFDGFTASARFEGAALQINWQPRRPRNDGSDRERRALAAARTWRDGILQEVADATGFPVAMAEAVGGAIFVHRYEPGGRA